MRSGIKITLAAIVMLVSASCDRDRNHPGYTYYPDMVNSQAYETYSENPVFEEGYTMRPPAEGTIPRGVVPYPYEKSEEGRALAAVTLVNPLEWSDDVSERGKKMYNTYCIICHGPAADGKGSLFTSGKYTFPPASLISEKMLAAPESDIFHVITAGHGIMPAHGTMIRPDDRWKIAMYVKNVLQAQPIAP
jgi:mono/diheme cytochrome c family protein